MFTYEGLRQYHVVRRLCPHYIRIYRIEFQQDGGIEMVKAINELSRESVKVFLEITIEKTQT